MCSTVRHAFKIVIHFDKFRYGARFKNEFLYDEMQTLQHNNDKLSQYLSFERCNGLHIRGFDTAENGPPKVRPVANQNRRRTGGAHERGVLRQRGLAARAAGQLWSPPALVFGLIAKPRTLFPRLVLG